MAVIGIDLGTTNSLVSVYRNGRAELIPNELGQYMTPSCVSLMEDGSLVVGAVAKERLITHPERTAAAFKTWMGTEKTFSLGDRKFLPHELSAMVLRNALLPGGLLRQRSGDPAGLRQSLYLPPTD